MKESFRREQHMRQQSLFDLVFKKGKLIKGHLLNIWIYQEAEAFKKSEKCPPARLGMVVSRKTDRSAVRRNLWRRRIREAFRHHQSEIKPGTLLLIQSRRQEAIPSYKAIECDLLALLTKHKLQNEK